MTTAPCVPAIREKVAGWRDAGYPGASDTTRRLVHHWFYTDHRLANGRKFKYHPFSTSVRCRGEPGVTVRSRFRTTGSMGTAGTGSAAKAGTKGTKNACVIGCRSQKYLMLGAWGSFKGLKNERSLAAG